MLRRSHGNNTDSVGQVGIGVYVIVTSYYDVTTRIMWKILFILIDIHRDDTSTIFDISAYVTCLRGCDVMTCMVTSSDLMHNGG